jgi:hypothetical protein
MAAAEISRMGAGEAVVPEIKTQGGCHYAPVGSSLNLPWSLLHRMFFTMTGGNDASDKYHKPDRKITDHNQPVRQGCALEGKIAPVLQGLYLQVRPP